MFQPVVVPGLGETSDPAGLLAEITNWVHSEALRSLVEHFGGRIPELGLGEELAYLDEFTADAWDFRQHQAADARERNQVDIDAVTGDDERLVIAAADALGLVRPRRPRHPCSIWGCRSGAASTR